MVQTLEEILRSLTRPAAEALTHGKREIGRCLACAHRCLIAGRPERHLANPLNEGGFCAFPGLHRRHRLRSIEKKPFFHVFSRFPGAHSFGMLGIELHCSYGQNWLISRHFEMKRRASSPRAPPPRNWWKRPWPMAPAP